MHQSRELDAKRLIARFGGPTALRELLSNRGHQVALKTINQWGWRKNIPGNWLGILLAIAEDQDRPLRLSDYYVDAAPDFLQ
jgi:hypothetical protein